VKTRLLSIGLCGLAFFLGLNGLLRRARPLEQTITTTREQVLELPAEDAMARLGLTRAQREDPEALMRAFENFLRSVFPPPVPLVVERGPLEENTLGQTQVEIVDGEYRLRVVIREDLEGALLVNVLVHEWSHVYTFHPQYGGWEVPVHGAEWGAAMSLIWIALVGG
jgi:hypothetical protein